MENGIRTFLRGMIESGKVSGCAAAVVRGNEVVFREFMGTADAKRKNPVTERTAFRLASMTKPVTAAAVLLCCREHGVQLTDPVCRYLPEFSEMYLAQKNGNGFERGEKVHTPITLLHLLTHSSGLGSGPAGDWQFVRVQPQGNDTLAQSVSRYSNVYLDFVPASAQLYSPILGFDVLARVVEAVAGMNYADFVRDRIFRPLQMQSTTYRISDFCAEDLAETTRSENGVLSGSAPKTNFGDFPENYTGGGAGLISTLDDYVRFACMLLQGSNGESGGVLTPAEIAAMRKPYLSHAIEGICEIFNWGLGVRALEAQNEYQPLSVGSFGWSGAYGTHFWVDPVRNCTAVYMHNSETFGGAGAPHTFAFEQAVMQTLNH